MATNLTEDVLDLDQTEEADEPVLNLDDPATVDAYVRQADKAERQREIGAVVERKQAQEQPATGALGRWLQRRGVPLGSTSTQTDPETLGRLEGQPFNPMDAVRATGQAIKESRRPIVTGLGMGVGAVAGAPLGPYGAVLGAGTWAVGTEALQQVGEHLYDYIYPSGARVAPETGGEAVERLNRAQIEGLTGEMGGQAAGKAFSWALGPLRNRVTEAGRRLIDAVGYERTRPSQATESWFLGFLENIAEGSITGGGRMQTARKATEAKLEDLAQGLVKEYGGFTDDFLKQVTRGNDPEVVGYVLTKALKRNNELFHDAATALYKNVDKLSPGVQVDLRPLVDFAEHELFRRRALPPSVAGESGLKLLREVLDTFGDVSSVPFIQAQMLRSRLGMAKASPTDPGKDVYNALVDQLAIHTRKAMETAAKTLKPEAWNAYVEASRFYREKGAEFNNQVIRRLLATPGVNLKPEDVAKVFTETTSAAQLQRFRTAVGDRAFDRARALYLEDFFHGPGGPEFSGLDGGSLMRKLARTRPHVLDSMLGREHADSLRDLVKIIVTAQSEQAGGTGRVAIQLLQTGAATGAGVSLVMGNLPGLAASGAALVGPNALARIFTSPTATKWLTTGLTAPPGSREAVMSATRLGIFLGQEDLLTSRPKKTALQQVLDGDLQLGPFAP